MQWRITLDSTIVDQPQREGQSGLPESLALSPEEIRPEVAIIKNRPLDLFNKFVLFNVVHEQVQIVRTDPTKYQAP